MPDPTVSPNPAPIEPQPETAVPHALGSEALASAGWSRVLVVVLVVCICLGLGLIMGAGVLNAQGGRIFSTIAEPLCPPSPCH